MNTYIDSQKPEKLTQPEAAPDDSRVATILEGYHRKGISDRKQISKLLFDEHGITLRSVPYSYMLSFAKSKVFFCSETSISRRKKRLGLRASRSTTQEMNEADKRQLILDQMAKDPTGKVGPRTVKQGIFADTGIHLTRSAFRLILAALGIAHAPCSTEIIFAMR